MNKLLFYLFVLTFGIVSTSCSNEDKESEEISKGSYAPEASQIVAKEFRFYINPPKWAFKCLPSDVQGEGLVQVATNTSLHEPAVWYNKTGKNTAHITVSFADKSNGRGYYYDYDLIFVDAHQGKFSGSCKTSQWDLTVWEEVEKTVKQSGYFAYNTTSDPDFDNIDDWDDDDEPEVDLAYLCNSWVSEQGNITQYLTFYKNDSYLLVQTEGAKYQEEEGNYLLDKGQYYISILPKGATEADLFKIVYLDAEELELRKVFENNSLGQAVIFSRSNTDGTEHKPGGNGGEGSGGNETGSTDSELNVFISSIQANSAYYYISYTNPNKYTNSSDYLVAGVCYSKLPHPTIDDAHTGTVTIKPEQSSGVNLPDLERNTTYYIRPYTLKNRIPTYYTETSFITQGGNSVYVSLTYLQGNTVQYNYSINMEGSYNTYIYYYNPIRGKYIKGSDFGVLKKGDQDSGKYTYPYEWEDKSYLAIIAEDTKTGQSYIDFAYK